MSRMYNCKDSEMLFASLSMSESFEAHKAEMISANPVWADPFIGDLKTRINKTINEYFGAVPESDSRFSGDVRRGMEKDARNELGMFKARLEVNLEKEKDRLKWILSKLGFEEHFQRKDVKFELYELLVKFNKNMTADLITELNGKGFTGEMISKICDYANTLKKANTDTGAEKNTAHEMTDEAVKEFNEIYSVIMKIAKIGRKRFTGQPVLSRQFTFSKIVAARRKAKMENEG